MSLLSEETVEVEVNPVYKPLYHNQSRYLILYGGAGSGKSVFASQKIAIRAVSENRHRFLIIRKVATTLRESVFKRFAGVISDMNLSNEWEINKTEMKFTHESGNEIMCMGLDDPEKLKSIEGVTGIWVEEATELSEEDLDQLDLRLRGTTQNYKQIIITFNPIDENHWLKSRFFDIDDPWATTVKTTFRDNKFIDEEYKSLLAKKASRSPNLHRIYDLGEWGKEEVQRPWVHNFTPDRHISERAKFNPNLPVYFSLDFNVEPFVCECAHLWRDGSGIHKHNFKELVIENNGDVHTMCDLMLDTFGPTVMANAIFTGDAMQKKREITQKNNIDAWRIIENRFRLGSRLKVPRGNPKVSENRHLINTVYAFHPDNIIHPDCKKLIFDLRYVESDEEGDIIKKDRNNKAQRSDALDCERYLINSFLYDFLEKYAIK